ncbi:MAG: hypothetical protein FWD33_01860 [Alphaproteobacteria bacterium]|nr:hypothetical protein [Alphaproteobacteria bacterium]
MSYNDYNTTGGNRSVNMKWDTGHTAMAILAMLTAGLIAWGAIERAQEKIRTHRAKITNKKTSKIETAPQMIDGITAADSANKAIFYVSKGQNVI